MRYDYSKNYCLLTHLDVVTHSQTKGAEDIKRVMANNVDINIGRVRHGLSGLRDEVRRVHSRSVHCGEDHEGKLKPRSYHQNSILRIQSGCTQPINKQTSHGSSDGFSFRVGSRHTREK
ncbi:unnamed protein product [Phytophthora fragariaefolia]|uniref:Unnamed protein product n=1 Tax=Phytophthora fragariaefolia TaxID=1490495 RepID=A0A9W6XAE1_9STRA|nr:unnamed protein product [Phytophthora fragariaefolia]